MIPEHMNFLIRIMTFLLIFCAAFILVGCANQPVPMSYDPPGFFSGILHGATILFSLIGSIFIDIRIYAFPNSGFFYDLGYIFGVGWYVFFTAAVLSG